MKPQHATIAAVVLIGLVKRKGKAAGSRGIPHQAIKPKQRFKPVHAELHFCADIILGEEWHLEIENYIVFGCDDIWPGSWGPWALGSNYALNPSFLNYLVSIGDTEEVDFSKVETETFTDFLTDWKNSPEDAISMLQSRLDYHGLEGEEVEETIANLETLAKDPKWRHPTMIHPGTPERLREVLEEELWDGITFLLIMMVDKTVCFKTKVLINVPVDWRHEQAERFLLDLGAELEGLTRTHSEGHNYNSFVDLVMLPGFQKPAKPQARRR